MRLASETPIALGQESFAQMLDFVRLTDRMASSPEYAVRLERLLSPTAHFIPARPAMLMGYDFHLTPAGPKLIEINNNAGGLYVQKHQWIPQPPIAELPGSLTARLLQMFPPSLRHIAIMDEDITHQHMYPEMLAFAELLRGDGRRVWLVTPEQIEGRDDGLWIEGERLDGIYNRHTDFYLESAAMAHIRRAFLLGTVDLNPFPRSYALLGEKTRMADWWRPGWLDAWLDASSVSLIHAMVPETHLLREMDAEQVWKDRKRWVFKPAARHGGKGVIVGKNISRTRFSAMGEDTIIQDFIPPSLVSVDGREMKLDVRLYTYGTELIAVAGRVWQGQVTNFQAEGSGWVAIDITP
jgi:ATP-grasp domain